MCSPASHGEILGIPSTPAVIDAARMVGMKKGRRNGYVQTVTSRMFALRYAPTPALPPTSLARDPTVRIATAECVVSIVALLIDSIRGVRES